MSLSKVLSNGWKVVTQSVGNQTMTQVYDNVGDLVKTRIKKISRYTVPPKVKPYVGFVSQNTTSPKGKDVIQITKNLFDSKTDESFASILDKVYKDGVKLGEREVYTQARSYHNPMEAMNTLKARANYSKKLRFFEDGVVAKENTYEYVDKLRSKRTIYDRKSMTLCQKEIDKLEQREFELRNKLDDVLDKRAYFWELLDKNKSKIKHEHDLHKLTINSYKESQKMEKIILGIEKNPLKTKADMAQAIEQLNLLKSLIKNPEEQRNIDVLIHNYLLNDIPFPRNLLEDLIEPRKNLFEINYDALIRQERKSFKEKISQLKSTQPQKEIKQALKELRKQEIGLEKEYNTIYLKKHKLWESIEELSHPETIKFAGASLKTRIDDVDFTI